MATKLRAWGLFTLESATLGGAVAIVNAHGQLPTVIVIGGSAFDGDSAGTVATLRERFDARIPAVVAGSLASEGRAVAGDGLWFVPPPLRFDRLRSLLHHVLAAKATS
jgi:hypothetical protein